MQELGALTVGGSNYVELDEPNLTIDNARQHEPWLWTYEPRIEFQHTISKDLECRPIRFI